MEEEIGPSECHRIVPRPTQPWRRRFRGFGNPEIKYFTLTGSGRSMMFSGLMSPWTSALPTWIAMSIASPSSISQAHEDV